MTNLLKNDMVENNIPYRIFKGNHTKNFCFFEVGFAATQQGDWLRR
jgi:hypothetical protein